MNQIVISKGDHKYGGGLWSDVISIHKNSRLPLFWSFHKNSIIDKYFEIFNKIRLEEDSEYARVAELKRHLMSTCITNCGSFLFSGYSDGWLVKNFIETGKIVKKFKYTDHVKVFNQQESIYQVFTDKNNSFVILIKKNEIIKLDFYTGMILSVFKLSKFSNELKFTFSDCLIEIDQKNNFIVMVTQQNSILILNWLNMTVVRHFNLKNQEKPVNILIAKNFKKILVSSEDKKLGVYDIFSSQLLSLFQLDDVLISMDINEHAWTIAGCYPNQKSVHLWKIDNLDWKIEKVIPMNFESNLRDMKTNKRDLYFEDKIRDQGKILHHQSNK